MTATARIDERPRAERLLVGQAPSIRRVREVIARVAATDATVLLTGESGTGKELAARALHEASPRAGRAFVAINCAAIPSQLLESELFGHVRGAFTGATRDKDGAFAAAHESTLFLDEIGEASLEVQAKLLRVVEERRYVRVGSTVEEPTDVRLVAATNRDLYADVLAGRFRRDFYFRLRVVPIAMPALRERVDDLPALADFLLDRIAERHRVTKPRFGPGALEALVAHRWPGNVRELANVLEAAALLNTTGELRPADFSGLGLDGGRASSQTDDPERRSAWLGHVVNELADAPDLPPLRAVRARVERAYLEEVLRRHRGNVTASARAAERNRSDFYELLRRHGLEPNAFKAAANRET